MNSRANINMLIYPPTLTSIKTHTYSVLQLQKAKLRCYHGDVLLLACNWIIIGVWKMCVTPPSPKYNCYTPCLWRIHKRPSAYKRLRKPCLLVLSQRRLALKVSVDSHIILRKCKILPTSLRIINWNIITEAFTHITLHKHYIYILCRPDILLQDIVI